MNPRALAAWSLAALTIALTTGNPAYRALVLLCAFNVLLTVRRQSFSLRALLLGQLVAGMLAVLFTLLLSHTGADVLFTVPSAIPAIGGVVTLESLSFGLATALGIAAAVTSAAVLMAGSETHELVDALPARLARAGAAVGTAINLMPALGRSAREISDAQRMRGWRPRRLRDWPDLAVPVVLTALEGSMSLAEAMEARGYGVGQRTHWRVRGWSARDTVTTCSAFAAAAAFVALRAAGVAADWYPYPVLSAPAVNGAAVACCLALLVPGMSWRRPRGG